MQRFWDKVDISGNCWEWTAGVWKGGYGEFWFGDRMVQAHRFAYSLIYGPIPEGMCVCHHCDNPGCVKPSHLFLGTQVENQRDSVAKGRGADHRGEKNGNSKLYENDVHEIRRLYSLGVKSALLSKMWRINQDHVTRLVSRKSWRHI